MNLELRKNESGRLETLLRELEEWSDGDRLIRYLKTQCHASVTDLAEGPDARRWVVQISGCEILVDQSDWGFLSFSARKEAGDVVVRHTSDLLRGIPKSEWLVATETPFEKSIKAIKRSIT